MVKIGIKQTSIFISSAKVRYKHLIISDSKKVVGAKSVQNSLIKNENGLFFKKDAVFQVHIRMAVSEFEGPH